MKKLLPALVAGLLAAAGTVRADLTIVQKVEGLGQDMEVTAKFKGDKSRVDAAPNTSIIMDLKTGEMIQLIGPQKKYVKVPAQIAQAALESMKKMQGADAAKPQFTPTGKKDTINGFPAEEYTATVAGNKCTLWLTKAVPDYDKVLKEMTGALKQGPMAAMLSNYGPDLASLPGFPVRTINEIQPGQTATTTVVSVNTKPIADADFSVPADFKEMILPTLTPPAAAAEAAAAPTPGK